jgi:hypothetical protein
LLVALISVGLTSLFKVSLLTPPSFLLAVMSKKPVGLKIFDLTHPTLRYLDLI